MTQDPSIPHMCHAQVTQFVEHRGSDIVHFSCAILLDGAIWHAVVTGVGKQSRKELVNNGLVMGHLVRSFINCEFLSIFIVSKYPFWAILLAALVSNVLWPCIEMISTSRSHNCLSATTLRIVMSL